MIAQDANLITDTDDKQGQESTYSRWVSQWGVKLE